MKTNKSIGYNRLVAALTSVVLFTGCGGPPVAAPTGFDTYTSKDKGQTFKCDQPKDWDISGGGKQNAWAKFSSGTALVEARTDLTGSLMGNISTIAPQADVEEDLEPVAQVHATGQAQAEEKFGSYSETGKPEEIQCLLGPARRSEFTASSLGTTIHGYRTTILALDRRVVVYCTCNESDWSNLQPSFDRITTSFERQ